MSDILERLYAAKAASLVEEEARESYAEVAERAAARRGERRSFAAALREARGPAVIAEIKRASPSVGLIARNFDPALIAATYQEAGADVLFAPRVDDPTDLAQLLGAVDLPVSVLAGPNAPNVAELAELGVSRISTGGALAVAAYGALVNAATELKEHGTYGYWDLTKSGGRAVRAAFTR